MSRVAALTLVMVVVISILSFSEIFRLSSEIKDLNNSLGALSSKIGELNHIIINSVTTITITKTVTANNVTAAIVSTIYEEVKDSVVLIKALSPFGTSAGTGFLFDDEGHIITNEHVISGSERYFIYFFNGEVREAKLVGRDPYTDLAVLKVDLAGLNIKPLKLGDSSKLTVGEQIIVVGNPFELGWSVTTGVVSQKGRLFTTPTGFSIPAMIQIDAAVNQGSSGSPLLNMRGEVVGVVNSIEGRTGGFDGIAYAISSLVVSKVVPALIREGVYRHSWLGVSGRDVDPLVAEQLGIAVKRGFLVTDVIRDGPAYSAGIRPNDVIVKIDDVEVKTIADILTYLLEHTSPGTKVTLTVVRGEETLQLEVTLGERPAPP